MRLFLLASTALARPAAFLNTHSGAKLYVCATPQQADLDAAGYAALTWVQVKGVGNHGETGSTTNILSYDTWDSKVTQKQKGLTDAGSPEIECARLPDDPGQTIVRNAAQTNLNYAFKIELNDANVVGGTPTIRYNRGIVTGPRTPQGRNEDFDLHVFTLGLNQEQIEINPSAAGIPPTLTVAPAITGTAQVNSVLTVSNGTFTGDATIVRTYQWFAGGVLIPNANAATYVPQPANVGKVITARVTGTNAAGSAQGFAPPTGVVIA